LQIYLWLLFTPRANNLELETRVTTDNGLRTTDIYILQTQLLN
jgi:hypothetical protein